MPRILCAHNRLDRLSLRSCSDCRVSAPPPILSTARGGREAVKDAERLSAVWAVAIRNWQTAPDESGDEAFSKRHNVPVKITFGK